MGASKKWITVLAVESGSLVEKPTFPESNPTDLFSEDDIAALTDV